MAQRPVKERLIEAAFTLFEARGYEHTTVDDIADQAGVSRATFFRTFRSKEDVIFPDHDVVLGAVEARLAGATQQTTWVAVAEAVRLVLLHYVGEGDLARSRFRLTRSVSALRDKEIASTYQYQRVFRRFIHRWLGGGQDTALRAELMAAAVVTAHNHVLRNWLRGLTQQPEADFDTAMARTLDLFTERDPASGTTSVIVVQTTKDLDAVLPRLRTVLDDPT
jgi:AcrR family transcriptional regulator